MADLFEQWANNYKPTDEFLPVNISGVHNPANEMKANQAGAYGSTFGKKLAEQEFRPEERKQFYEEKALSDERVKKLLSNIGALKVIPEVDRQAQEAPIGPFSGQLYDAAINKFAEDGSLEDKDFIDKLIVKFAGKKTTNIKKLDELLGQLRKRFFETGGKALTGSEIKIQSSDIPTYLQEPSSFKSTLENLQSNITLENGRLVDQLKRLGYPQEIIDRLSAEAK